MYVYYYGFTQTRDVVNDGNNIYIGGGNFGYIRIDDDGDDRDFYAEKVVLKMPSEHTINGDHYDMELQIHHTIHDSDFDPDFPRKAIVSVLIRPGSKSYFIDSLDPEFLPGKGQEHTIVDSNINFMAIVDPSDTYYQYMGSVSYPECEEDVLWYVFETAQWVSIKQMEFFRKKLVKPDGFDGEIVGINQDIYTGTIEGNNRDVQPKHGRTVYHSLAHILSGILALLFY